MKVRVNSVERELTDGTTVGQLKELLGVGGMCAVAVNGQIVRASAHADHILSDGDDIVVIGAAYGG